MSKKELKIIVTVLGVCFAILSSIVFDSFAEGDNLKEQSAALPAEDAILEVIDGDTIQVLYQGRKETVRLIGVNTPETVDPRKPVECFGKQASAFTKAKAEGSARFTLKQDMTQDERDRYGRLLAYVFLDGDAMSLNEQIIREGYGYEYTYKVPYEYQAVFKEAEMEASREKRGLWADGVCYTN